MVADPWLPVSKTPHDPLAAQRLLAGAGACVGTWGLGQDLVMVQSMFGELCSAQPGHVLQLLCYTLTLSCGGFKQV